MKKLFLGALKSKTIGLGGIAAALAWLQNHPEVLQAVVPGHFYDLAWYGIAFAIVVVRFLTDKPLADK